jgi:RND family efflux transporter MFP subunit
MDKKNTLINEASIVKTSRFIFFKKFFSKKKIIISIILILISVGGLYFYQSSQNSSSDAEKYVVKRTTLRDELNLSGFIDADEKVDLHFQAGGKLLWLGVKEGQEVKKNQGIAALDQRQLQKNIEKYLNNYNKVRRNFEQTGEDYKDESLSSTAEIREKARRVLENSQFDLNNSVLDVELQTISKEYSYIYAPISGIVTKMDVKSTGMNITPQDKFQIINKDSLYFSLSVDQTEVVQIKEGMTGEVFIDAFPDKKFTGTVTSLGFIPKQNETGTVYEVKLAISGMSADLRLGMTGDVTFIVKEHKDVLSVPQNYVIDNDDETRSVYVINNGKQTKRTISTGLEVGDEIEIISGVGEGETLILVEE